MANNNLDPVHLAKSVADQLVRFPRGKSLEWKINFLRWKFEKQNFGDCCKMIIDGAEVALKVEEKLSNMEAKLKSGEGDEKLRLKVELVRRKVERYHLMMHLFSVSKNPGEFAACVRNHSRENDGESQAGEQRQTENIQMVQARARDERARVRSERGRGGGQTAGDVEATQVEETVEEQNIVQSIFQNIFDKRKERFAKKKKKKDERLANTRQKKELQRISKTASHQALIRLKRRVYGQFVAWKGNWGKGRAYVVSETGASVKNRGGERFFISGDKCAVNKAINMIVTQSLTAVASSDDYDIRNVEGEYQKMKNFN